MRFDKGQSYTLVEIDGGLVILNRADTSIHGPGKQPLIIADAEKLLTYLDRYFYERENGRPLKVAHELAMQTATITKVLPPFKKKGEDR